MDIVDWHMHNKQTFQEAAMMDVLYLDYKISLFTVEKE